MVSLAMLSGLLGCAHMQADVAEAEPIAWPQDAVSDYPMFVDNPAHAVQNSKVGPPFQLLWKLDGKKSGLIRVRQQGNYLVALETHEVVLMILNRLTGTKLRRVPIASSPHWINDTDLAVDDRAIYISWTTWEKKEFRAITRLIAFSPTEWRTLWSFEESWTYDIPLWQNERYQYQQGYDKPSVGAGLTSVNGRVYLSLYQRTNGPKLFALDARSGQILWQSEHPTGAIPLHGHPTLCEGKLFAAATTYEVLDDRPPKHPKDRNAYIAAFDPQSGQLLWERHLEEQQKGEMQQMPLMCQGDAIYAITSEYLWKIAPASGTTSHAVTDPFLPFMTASLLISEEDTIFLSGETSFKWALPTGTRAYGFTRYLRAYKLGSNSPLWKIPDWPEDRVAPIGTDYLVSRIVPTGSFLILATTSNQLHVREKATGKLVQNIPIEVGKGDWIQEMFVSGDILYVSLLYGGLYAYKGVPLNGN